MPPNVRRRRERRKIIGIVAPTSRNIAHNISQHLGLYINILKQTFSNSPMHFEFRIFCLRLTCMMCVAMRLGESNLKGKCSRQRCTIVASMLTKWRWRRKSRRRRKIKIELFIMRRTFNASPLDLLRL